MLTFTHPDLGSDPVEAILYYDTKASICDKLYYYYFELRDGRSIRLTAQDLREESEQKMLDKFVSRILEGQTDNV